MTPAENKRIANRVVDEVWNDQRVDRIDELYSPDYVGHWFRVDGEDADREAAKEFVREILEAFPDYEMNAEFVHADEEFATVGFSGSGTSTGQFMGIPVEEDLAVDRPIPGHMTFRIEDGTIAEGWATWDALGLLQGLGIVPTDLREAMPAADD